MITIFNGRELGLDGTKEKVYTKVSVALRDKIHCFNTGKSLNPFAIFMAISLHINENGWAYPGRPLLTRETGLKNPGPAIKHLCGMKIDGHRVLEAWRERRSDGTWGRTLYRIFPDAWPEPLSDLPTAFNATALEKWDPSKPPEQPPPYDPGVDKPPLEDRPHKKIHVVSRSKEEEKTAGAAFSPPNGQEQDPPEWAASDLFTHTMEDWTFPEFDCPCGTHLRISSLHNTAALCPECERPLRVIAPGGREHKKPPRKYRPGYKPRSPRSTLGDIIDHCPSTLASFTPPSKALALLEMRAKEHPQALIQALNWALIEKAGKIPHEVVYDRALSAYGTFLKGMRERGETDTPAMDPDDLHALRQKTILEQGGPEALQMYLDEYAIEQRRIAYMKG